MTKIVHIMLISVLSLISLAAVLIFPALLVLLGTPVLLVLCGSTITGIIQLVAPALVALALGFGIGFNVGTIQKKAPATVPVKMSKNAMLGSKPEANTVQKSRKSTESW